MRRSVAFVSVPAGILAFASFVAAQSIATDPVGFIKTPLLGGSDTYVSMPFTRPPEFIGAISAASGNTITAADNPWTANQFVYGGNQHNHYYALIGPITGTNTKEGHTYAVTANDSNTLTVDTTHDDLNGIPANTQVTLIPYWTPATLFPASDANVSFTPTTSPPNYQTLIRVPDYSAAGINLPDAAEYYFNSNAWRRISDNADHGDDTLLPGSYFVVRNAGNAQTLPLINTGAVLLKKLTVPLMTATNSAQDNPVSILRPLDVTLNASGLNPGNSAGSFVANDQLLLFDNSQAAFDKAPSAIYYYNTSVGNSGGWRLMGDNTLADRGSDIVPSGTGFLVRKAATASGQTEFWTNSFPVSALSAVSRKMHGTLGPFGIPLPLTGPSGIECRLDGPTEVVFTFPTAVTFNNAMVTSGTGSVATTAGNGTTTVTADLSGVINQQWVTLTLLGVNDGTNTNDVAVRIGVLLGDVNLNGVVTNADVSLVKAQVAAGASVGPSNFQDDINANGVITNADVSLTKAQVAAGAQLPTPP